MFFADKFYVTKDNKILHVNLYTVTYYPGSNAEGDEKSILYASYPDGTPNSIANKSNVNHSCEGYVLAGWATSDGGAKVYDLGQQVYINSKLDLYAVWEIDPQMLIDAKAAVKAELTTKYGTYPSVNYSLNNWNVLVAAKNNGLAAIDAAVNASGVSTARNAAIAAMEAVKTLAQELPIAKTEAKAELTAALGTYRQVTKMLKWLHLN